MYNENKVSTPWIRDGKKGLDVTIRAQQRVMMMMIYENDNDKVRYLDCGDGSLKLHMW